MAAQSSFPTFADAHPAKPILKWAGGKAKLLPKLRPLVPPNFGRYIEPFVGGGAFFFWLTPPNGLINDLNHDLIECYEVVRDSPKELLKELSCMEISKAEFYRRRSEDPRDLNPIRRAARFIYLNKTCFNGLYRVNRKGQFNSPFGGSTNVKLADEQNLYECSSLLARVTITSGDYRKALGAARKGDFIYLDPPYVPVGKYADFNRYTSSPFNGTNQEELAEVFADLDKKGCFVLLSNSNHPTVEALYRPYLRTLVRMPRFVNCKGDKRGDVDELLITNYEHPIELS